MTRIRFKVLRAITFLLVALAGLLGLANAELEFYQDVEPKSPQVSLERLVRFLEAKSHRSPSLHESHHHQQQQQQLQHQQLEQLQLQQEQQQLEQLQLQQEQHQLEQLQLHRKQQRNHQQHLLELARQKQRGLLRDDLPERPNIIDVLQREAADPLEYVRELERQRLLPYLEYEPAPRIKPYSIEDEARARLLPAQLSKDPMLDYPETQYVDLERARQLENARRIEEAYRRRPEFTYAFDKPEAGGGRNNEAKSSPFAVAPNDLRYYEPGPFQREQSTDEAPLGHKQKTVEIMDVVPEDSSPEPSTPKPRPKQQTLLKTSKLNDEDLPDTSLVESSMLPEPQRRAEQDPLVVSVGNKANNDIYFIAIVAGCSAAAMFALVLISLTWCRLQRVSKAAQDVEYPAYGVTGPNKDISPSGDQRLAQSAQMYHFQHQKQQIIAMENRASATRDPGSVSEAESDEENEEGDYTVYECPGLAPTGEMEVKNPLFHDDPTPATPAKSKKDDDEDDV